MFPCVNSSTVIISDATIVRVSYSNSAPIYGRKDVYAQQRVPDVVGLVAEV